MAKMHAIFLTWSAVTAFVYAQLIYMIKRNKKSKRKKQKENVEQFIKTRFKKWLMGHIVQQIDEIV